MDTKEIVDCWANKAGWSDKTIIDLLVRFVDMKNQYNSLADFLGSQAKAEEWITD